MDRQNQNALDEQPRQVEQEGFLNAAREDTPDAARVGGPIPTHWAYQLCDIICQENRETRFSLAKLICRRCRNDPSRMGFARRPDNRACFLVNAREEHYRRAFHRFAA